MMVKIRWKNELKESEFLLLMLQKGTKQFLEKV